MGGKGGAGRIANHAAQGIMQLQLVDLVLHILHPVAADGVQNLLGLGGSVCIDSRGGLGDIEVGAINGALDGAAALLIVEAGLIDTGVHSGKALAKIALGLVCELGVLIADLTNCIVSLSGNRSLIIIQTAHSVLQIVEVHAVTQASLGHRLPVCAPAKAVTAPTEDQGKQDNQHPGTTTAKAAVVPISIAAKASTGDSRHISGRHILSHVNYSFRIYLINTLRTVLISKSSAPCSSQGRNPLQSVPGTCPGCL